MLLVTLLFPALSTPLLVAAVSVVVGINPPSQPPKTLTVKNAVIAPDGFKRSTVLVDGQHPAPLLTAKKGSRFRFNVENKLTDPTMQRATSIHWHGFFQKGTNYADGPTGVSQCPIAPGDSFLYDFSTNNQAGTFWYHSHFSAQYCDGLRGPIVVYDDEDPFKKHKYYEVDDENTIITLTEWYHTPGPSMLFPAPHSILINGKGRFTGGPAVPLSVINVVRNKKYRFRLLAISCEANFKFSIDGHPLLVIEADGQNLQPYTADKIQIFAGQRYSFVLFANQKTDNYWIRALPNIGKGDITKGFNGGVNSAILRYQGAPKVDPKTQDNPKGKLLKESDLHPYDTRNCRAPGTHRLGAADVSINLDIGIDLQALRFLINNQSYTPPTVPILLQMLSGSGTPQQLMPAGSIYTLPRNRVIEVTIPTTEASGPHPFHLHGHAFSVIRSAGNDTRTNFENPVVRDVVSIGDIGSNVTIRFVTDNPGPWLFHCHIDWHLDIGLAVVFAEDQPDVKATVHPPPDWNNVCKTFDSLPPSATALVKVPEVP